MIWSGLWIEPHLLWLHWWFLTLCYPFKQTFSYEGGWTWRLVVILFFFHIGGGIIWCHKLTHINNPWLFRAFFINLFIIKFIVINVQIGRVRKHSNITSTIISIPCPTILNDIFFSEIDTCKNNNNLMFAQVSMQCPFPRATSILSERKWDLVCHIWMLLVSYHPCMASFIWIIYSMGDMSVKDQCGLLNVHFYDVFHNLIFYKLAILHFSHVYCLATIVVSLHTNQLTHWPRSPFVSKEDQCFNAPW